MVAFFTLRAVPGVEYATAEVYRRVIVIGGVAGELTVAPAAHGTALLVTAPLVDEALLSRVRRMFDVDTDPAAIAAHFAADSVMAPLVAARPGVRIPNGWDGHELAVRAVLGQQITVVQAARLAGKLAARFGRQVGSGVLSHAFPEAAALVDADIASLGMPRSRAETIRAVSRAALESPTIFAPGGSIERLHRLRGIGEWTAQYIAMRAMGDRDAFPASDIGLLRAMADNDGARPTPKALLERAETWRPLRAYAAQHLWTADAGRLTEEVAQGAGVPQ